MKHTRRDAIGAMIAGSLALAGVRIATADQNSQLPDASQTGFRSGPLGPTDGVQTLASERPTAMIVPDAEVDAEVEINHIVDGQMLDPTGAWVVAWYEGTGLLHEKRRNMLYSGHVDYWSVGPAVFRSIANLQEGAPITLMGDKGGQAVYAVEYVERVTLAEMTPEKMQEITAPTPFEALTIITCGGEFDYDAGAYLQRDIIRARLVQGEEVGDPVSGEAAPDGEIAAPEATATADVADQAPAGNEAAASGTASITQDNVNVRAEASTDGTPVAAASSGDTVTVTGAAVEADGYTWYPVKLDDGTTGFIVADFLELNP